MNIINNPLQSDTKLGEIQLPCAASLVGAEGKLLKIVNNSGAANFALPSAIGDPALFILASGYPAGQPSVAEAPYSGGNARAKASGAITPGAYLALDAANWGQLIVLPGAAGTYFSPGIAEEAAAAGGLVKFRPLPQFITVA